MRAYLIGGAVGAVFALALAWGASIYLPAWNAERLYEQADLSHDNVARCDAATRAAEAWSAAGSYERAKEWRNKAGMPCSLVAFNESLVRGSR